MSSILTDSFESSWFIQWHKHNFSHVLYHKYFIWLSNCIQCKIYTMACVCHWLEKFEGITLQNWMEKTLEKICYQVMDRHAWIITGTTTTRKQFKEIESRKHSGNVFLCPENEENGAKKHIYYPFFLFPTLLLGLWHILE